jgi:hypothetical protein
MSWYTLHKTASLEVEVGSHEVPFITDHTGQKKESISGPDLARLIRSGLTTQYSKLDEKGIDFLSKRYRFTLQDWKDQNRYMQFSLGITPLDEGEEVLLDKDDPMYDYIQKHHGGRTGKYSYKTPKDAIESIPEDDSLAYRGIAWEEWQAIRKNGFVKSRGVYNIGEGQQNYTMFGHKPSTAMSYASGFAPLQYQPGKRVPSVIISVDKEILLTHEDDPKNIPQSELASPGNIPIERIRHVWLVILTEYNDRGFVDLHMNWIKDGDIWRLDPSKVSTGSGIMSVGNGYSVRQLY